MGEIRLICPGCEAEYRLPADAIPATGREVECTACGHVWLAHPDAPPRAEDQDGDDEDDAAVGLRWWPAGTESDEEEDGDEDDEGDAYEPAPGQGFTGPAARGVATPPGTTGLHRPLPDDVLSILRDEVEHERRARMAEDTVFGRASAATPLPPDGGPEARPAAERSPRYATEFSAGRIRPDEADWPATTISAAAEPFAAPAPMRDEGFAPGAAAAPDLTAAGWAAPEPAAAAHLPVAGQAPESGDGMAPPMPDLPDSDPAPDAGAGQPDISGLHAPGLHAAELHAPQPGEGALVVADWPAEDLPQPGRDLPGPTHDSPVRSGPDEPAALPARGSYGTGFGLAAMIAAIGFAAYLMAPGLADAGPLGEALGAYRMLVDDVRLWLQGVIGVSLI